ncbi:hypothetical protein MASR2M69_19920 [Bacteroidota bacterium]
MEKTNIEKALFVLVRNALMPEGAVAKKENITLTHPEWGELLTLAAKQGLFAVACDGLSQFNKESLHKDIAIRWGVGIEQIEKRYTRQIAVLNELSAIFKKRGVDILLLKGPLLGNLYPVKEHREFGDLDIYLPGNYDKGNEIIEKLGIGVDTTGDKHSKFTYRGISIENHKTFLNVTLNKTDISIERELHRILDEQSANQTVNQTVNQSGCLNLYENQDNDLPVKLPPDNFTALFAIRHAIVHFLSSGLVIRHLTDLGLLFESRYDKIDFMQIVKILNQERLLKLFVALLTIIKSELGMERGIILTKLACSEQGIDFTQLAANEELVNKIYIDTIREFDNRPNADALLAMPLIKRKITGAVRLYNSRWKYDSIEKNLYYKTLIKRVLLAFKQ